MFRSRSKFDNEAPMSRRGVRVGLVFTVALAMVAVLASTVGVLSSQSTTPTVAFGNSTYSEPEGDTLTVTLTSSSSAGYDLLLGRGSSTTSSFDFDQDIVRDSFVLTPDVGNPTPITGLPQTVTIESGTTMITLTFVVANDLLVENPNEQLVLTATPGSGAPKTTTITLQDHPIIEATFSVTSTSPIAEGTNAQINFNLNNALTEFLKSNRRSGYTREEFTGSNFEDISSIAGAAFPVDDNNEQYDRNLGFDFEFYGTRHSDIAVHTNGFVGFTNNAKADVDEFVDPTPGTLNGDKTPGNGVTLPIVAPLLSPIAYIGQTGAAFYGARLGAGTADDRYIVQYTKAASLVPGAPSDRVPSTFQVALYANGRIEFRYEDIPSSVQNVSKIGISNGTGTGMFDEFSYRTTNLGAVSNVRIVYTPGISAVIKDSRDNTVATVDFLANVAVGANNGSFMVSHPENTDWVGNEVYTVALESAVPLVTAPDPAPAAVTYTVMDNDKPEVTLERVSGSGPIAEDTSVELRARLTNAPGGALEDLLVKLSTASVTRLESSEYTFPGEVTIPQNGQYVDFTVNIHQDTLVELDELLQLQVSRLDYSTTMHTPVSMPSIDLMIRSDDMITAEITAANTRENGTVNVTIKLGQALLSGVVANSLMLVLDGTDRTADIMSGLPTDITQALKNGRETTVRVVLNDDKRLEGDEVVNVRLAYTTSDIPFLPATSGSFTIIDNEVGGMVEIATLGNTRPEEDDTVRFAFMLDLAAGVTTDIPVMVEFDITAPPGVTYEVPSQPGVVTVSAPGLGTGFARGLALPVRGLAQLARSYMITIPAMTTGAVLTVRLTDDATAEETEKLAVRLGSVSTSSAEPLIQRNPSKMRVEVEVLDNEPIEFEIIGNGEVNEDDGTYQVQLRRRGRIDKDGKIPYTIVGQGADEGDFVGALTGEFEFNGYEPVSKQVILILNDDNSEEEPKPFQISIENPMTKAYGAAPIVDSVTGARFTSIMLIDSDLAAFSGLPATGGPVLPIWLVLLLALTGVALLVPTLRRLI